MNYTIDIIDTVNLITMTIEKAAASSVVLGWDGNDNINENFIIGSSLDFTLISEETCLDQAFFDLLTKDEDRYKVEIKDDNSELIWNGFLLPDFYEEPYNESVTVVSFTAVDRLGTLKGKFLSDDFYEDQKPVLDIFLEILNLTGLDMSIAFSPAIKNTERGSWQKVYLDTSWFIEGDKKMDAYTILDKLMKSMLCSVYQRGGEWNIVGFNQQQNKFYDVLVYDEQRSLNGTREREIKTPIFLGDPIIGSVVPYGIIDVTTKQEPTELPKGLSNVNNLGWSSNGLSLLVAEWEAINVSGSVLNPREGVYANSDELTPKITTDIDRIHIKNRPFLKKGIYRLKLTLDAVAVDGLDNDILDGYKADGLWKNPLAFYASVYKNIGDTDVILANSVVNEGYVYKDLDFTEEDTVEINILFNVYQDGIFDMNFSSIFQTAKGLDYIKISDLSLENVNFEEEPHYKITNEGWTDKKEVTIDFSDDSRGVSQAFLLEDTSPDDIKGISVGFNRRFKSNGKWYLSLDLSYLHLLDKYSWFNSIIDTLNIIGFEYNYLDSNEHFIIIDDPIGETLVGFDIEIPVYLNSDTNREDWEQWTDTFYGIERERYGEVVASIYNRLQNDVFSEMNDVLVEGNLLFGDFVHFSYPVTNAARNNTYEPWMIKKLSWDIDKGRCSLGLRKPYYNGGYNSIKGIVLELGADKYYNPGQSIEIIPQISTPSSFVTDYFWEELTGNNISPFDEHGQVLTTPNQPPNAAHYKFRLTITDNYGQTATDTIDVFNFKQNNISLIRMNEEEIHTDTEYYKWKERRLQIYPDIHKGSLVLVNIKGKEILKAALYFAPTFLIFKAGFDIRVNGNIVYSKITKITDDTASPVSVYEDEEHWNINILISHSDEVIVRTEISLQTNANGWAIDGSTESSYVITNATYQIGYGEITGAPIYNGTYI